MSRAAAAIARGKGNTAVGSLIVLDGQVIAETRETLPSATRVTGHAEVLACQGAIDRTGFRDLAGTTLYTTAEPCFMCSTSSASSGSDSSSTAWRRP